MNKRSRLANIELLRILCMIMIVCGHAILYGKFGETSENHLNDFLIGYLRTICSVAVNCYMLISGYFLVNSAFKLSKLLDLWIAVFTYSVGIYLISLLCQNTGLQLFV